MPSGIYSFEPYPVRKSVDPRVVGQFLVQMQQQQMAAQMAASPAPFSSPSPAVTTGAGMYLGNPEAF